MNEWLMNFVSGNTVTVAAGAGAGIWWIVHRSFSHDSQIKNLGTKIDHLDEKMDRGFKHLEDKIDALIGSHNERISRLEKYFDIIMSTQIKKQGINLSEEGGGR